MSGIDGINCNDLLTGRKPFHLKHNNQLDQLGSYRKYKSFKLYDQKVKKQLQKTLSIQDTSYLNVLKKASALARKRGFIIKPKFKIGVTLLKRPPKLQRKHITKIKNTHHPLVPLLVNGLGSAKSRKAGMVFKKNKPLYAKRKTTKLLYPQITDPTYMWKYHFKPHKLQYVKFRKSVKPWRSMITDAFYKHAKPKKSTHPSSVKFIRQNTLAMQLLQNAMAKQIKRQQHLLVNGKIRIQDPTAKVKFKKTKIANTLQEFHTIAQVVHRMLEKQQQKNLRASRKIKPGQELRVKIRRNLQTSRKFMWKHRIKTARPVGTLIFNNAQQQYLAKHTAMPNKSLKNIDNIVKQRGFKNKHMRQIEVNTRIQNLRLNQALNNRVLMARFIRNAKTTAGFLAYQQKEDAGLKSWMFYKLAKKARLRKLIVKNNLLELHVHHTTKGLSKNLIEKQLQALHFLKQQQTTQANIDHIDRNV